MSLDRHVARHYAHGSLAEAVLAALAVAGKNVDALTPEDLAPIDEFHVRGREATAELGRGLGLRPEMHVLDVGSGIGGPSRHLAEVYGCRITGIDLTEEFCAVAAMLAERIGCGEQVTYRQANALAMPFDDGTYDAAYTQHVAMNVEDKAALYAEIRRVLKPGATFGIYDLLQGAGGQALLPAPWAREPSASFLVTPDQLRALLEAAGFEILSWRDTTAEGRAWFMRMRDRMSADGPPALGCHIVLGDDFTVMARNQVRNLMEDRIAPTEVICRKRTAE